MDGNAVLKDFLHNSHNLGGGGGGGLVVCNISTLNAPSIFLFILEFSKDFKICFQFVKFYNSPHVEMQ